MNKPIGGRGKRAPYDTVMVRTPVPIKAEVEALINRYRNTVVSDSESNSEETEDDSEYLSAIKLVDRFVSELGQTEKLNSPTVRNNRNLSRFRRWLESRIN